MRRGLFGAASTRIVRSTVSRLHVPTLLRRAYASLPAPGFYQRVPPQFWRNLSSLSGVYKASRFEAAVERCTAVFFVCLGSLSLGDWLRPYIAYSWPRHDHWAGLPFALLCGSIAIFLFWRAGLSYKFADGSLSALDSRGRTRWQESLERLPRADYTWNGIGTYITLRWVDRRRTIRVWDSLERALRRSCDS